MRWSIATADEFVGVGIPGHLGQPEVEHLDDRLLAVAGHDQSTYAGRFLLMSLTISGTNSVGTTMTVCPSARKAASCSATCSASVWLS